MENDEDSLKINMRELERQEREKNRGPEDERISEAAADVLKACAALVEQERVASERVMHALRSLGGDGRPMLEVAEKSFALRDVLARVDEETRIA